MQVPETKLFEQFVDRTLDEVALGLELDNSLPGSKKRKVRDALVRRARGDGASPRNAAQKVIEGRFMLGGDDASYLASGLACLWSTVGASGADAHPMALAPSSLYAPDAVNGIRQGLLKALEQRNADAQKEAPKQLPMLLRLLATIVDFVPDVPSATKQLLRRGVVKSASERLMVMAFLKSLKEIMADASDSAEDPETSLARRILRSARAGSTASLERVVRINEVERANAALTQKYEMKQAEWKANVDQQQAEYKEKIRQATADLEKEFERRTKSAENDKINGLERKLAASLQDALEKDYELLAKSKAVGDRDRELQKLREINARNKEASASQTAQLEEQVRAKEAALVEKDDALVRAELWSVQATAARDAAQAARDGMGDVNAQLRDAERAAREAMTEAQEQRNVAAGQVTAAQQELRKCQEEKLLVAEALIRKEEELESARREKDRAAMDARAAAVAAEGAADKALAQQRDELRTQMNTLTNALKNEFAQKEASWKQEIEELERSAETRNEALQACLEEKKTKQRELKDCLAELEDCLAEKGGLRNQVDNDLGKAKADLDAQIAALKEAQAQKADAAYAENLKQLEAARAEVQHAQEEAAKAEELNQQLQKVGDEYRDIERKMREELEKQNRDAEEVLGLKDAELQLAREELEDAKDELRVAQQALEDAQLECSAKAVEGLDGVLDNTKENYETLLRAVRTEFELRIQGLSSAIAKNRIELADLKVTRNKEMSKKRNAIKADASLSQAQKNEAIKEANAEQRAELRKAVEDANRESAEWEKEKAELREQLRANAAAIESIPELTTPPPPEPPPKQSPSVKLYNKIKTKDLVAREAKQSQKWWLLNAMEGVPDDGYTTDAFANADNSFSHCAVIRGLVGQRAPTEPASAKCAHDDLLAYALPELKEFVKRMVPVRTLLESSPDPTADELSGAEGAHAPKRQKLNVGESPAAISEALEAFGDNFAIIGRTPVAELPVERYGVEKPHEVRWMPQGARAETMARVAVMEHALARCKQVAYHADTGEEAARALRRAQAALKFAQMQELYALNEAVEFDDDPHPLGTHASLVTRPCAQIRGTLSYPTDPGVQAIGQDQAPAGDLNGSVALANAMRESAADTAALRNELRRQGLPSHFYVAPPADQIAFTPAPNPTGAGDADDPSATAPELQPAANAQTVPAATRVPEAAPAMPTDNVTGEPTAAVSAERASERLRPSDYSTDTWQRVINRAIVAASALRFEGEPDNGNSQDATGAFLEMNKSTRDGAGEVTAQTRRDGLWNEMTRHVAISQDRLWVFIRLMGGSIGGDVQEVITMADAATLRAAKAIQDQRLEIAKRVSDMQAKIVETVVASMLKKSEMTMSLEDDHHLAVIDGDAKKKLDELASGASGRPFFEANVALKNLTEKTNQSPPALKDVLSGLANVGVQLQGSLEQSLAEPSAASASLVELSHPSNSYFVAMRPDAVAAIRSAHETLNSELGVVGGRRRLALWELVEGGCQVLTRRFAELCGFLLVQTRTCYGCERHVRLGAEHPHEREPGARGARQARGRGARVHCARVAARVRRARLAGRALARARGRRARHGHLDHRDAALGGARTALCAPLQQRLDQRGGEAVLNGRAVGSSSNK